MMVSRVFAAFLLIVCMSCGLSRRHTLNLKNDVRRAILCSHFGFLRGSYFSVFIEQLIGDLSRITLSLDKSANAGVAAYLEGNPQECFRGDSANFLYLSIDMLNSQLLVHNKDPTLSNLIFEAGVIGMDEDQINRPQADSLSAAIRNLLDLLMIAKGESQEVAQELTQAIEKDPKLSKYKSFEQSAILQILYRLAENHFSASELAYAKDTNSRRIHDAMNQSDPQNASKKLTKSTAFALKEIYKMSNPLGSLVIIPYKSEKGILQAKFTIQFRNASEEGMYSFYLHDCAVRNTETGKLPGLNLTLRMVEKNPGSFLSAGQQPLPLLYFVLCCAYFTASLTWFIYLRSSKNSVYRIHYLMFTVVLIKAISLVFHGVNFYAIGQHGMHEETWAVMYYITHIIRGALLFITILLIGAGWAFIKHMLTPRERNVFFIVIPLQILANVATIVIEESEAGTARYALWKDILIFVDLACCGAVLFPVVWSIRHLQAASHTDGKAAINLRNLRLFRHFYILVICYIYSTRVIAYLLTITVPYTLTWVVELFKESITFFFFVAVGYKFRPVDDNPYLLVPNEDDDEDTVMERIQLEDVWSQSGYTDGVTRLGRQNLSGAGKRPQTFVDRTRADSNDPDPETSDV